MAHSYLRITRGALGGCCHGSNFYNIGYAHGHPRAKSVDDFADKFISLGYAGINIAVTNSVQGTERKFLEAIGFKEGHRTPGGLYCHVASRADLDKGLKSYRESRMKRMEEERARKLVEQRAKEEEERQRRAAVLAANGGKLQETAKVSQIRKLLVPAKVGETTWYGGRYDRLASKKAILDYYNITERRNRNTFPNYAFNDYDLPNAARAVNYRLRKEGKIV